MTSGAPTVLALGGNALLRSGERGTAAEQRANLADTFAAVAGVLAEPVVVTHGNGPQVGNELLRQELAAAEAPPLPLYLAVAQTQAEIGALAASELERATGRPAAVVLTRVVVAADDPAFADPTKPIGPFYEAARARKLEHERGWALREEGARGYRRVVASPRPLEILELESIRALAAAGTTVVAAGGGGIPVVARDGRHDGVDAVVDKDLASALLAERLGSRRLVVLTQVPALFRDFGTERQAPVRELRPERDAAIVATLPAGSMRPKIEAAFAFVRATGGEALVASAEGLRDGDPGTRIVP